MGREQRVIVRNTHEASASGNSCSAFLNLGKRGRSSSGGAHPVLHELLRTPHPRRLSPSTVGLGSYRRRGPRLAQGRQQGPSPVAKTLSFYSLPPTSFTPKLGFGSDCGAVLSGFRFSSESANCCFAGRCGRCGYADPPPIRASAFSSLALHPPFSCRHERSWVSCLQARGEPCELWKQVTRSLAPRCDHQLRFASQPSCHDITNTTCLLHFCRIAPCPSLSFPLVSPAAADVARSSSRV